MINTMDKIHCCGCGVCMVACPTTSIKMVCDENGFRYPVINRETCINCKICNEVCADSLNAAISILDTYAAFNQNDKVRFASSSGGVFSLLAELVLSMDGYVVGAAFDEKFQVEHILTNSLVKLEKIRGSKYVESKIETKLYVEIETKLRDGKIVLFSGTPCQCAALKSYLKKDYEKLLLIDIVCHGVPSAKIWGKYLCELKEKYNSEIESVHFRDKSQGGWHKFNFTVSFENGEKYSKLWNVSTWGKIFTDNLFLRPSCYYCRFKGYSRYSDLTLGDLWGVEEIKKIKKIDDNGGLSLILVHTKKGNNVLAKINGLQCYSINLEDAEKKNPSLYRSVDMPYNQSKFDRALETHTLEWIADKYWSRRLIMRIKYKVWNILKNTSHID